MTPSCCAALIAQNDSTLRQGPEWITGEPELRALLDAIPTFLLLMNPQRQAVFANRAMLGLLELARVEDVYGLRPGELLGCEHVTDGPGGCGTQPACALCGAARALSIAETTLSASVQECRITQRATGTALDLRVSATPVQLDGRTYTLLALTDISHEKRRQSLERIFLHDLLNTASGMMSYAELLNLDGAAALDQAGPSIRRLVGTLIDEIRAQRELSAAEDHELVTHFESLDSLAILQQVLAVHGANALAHWPVLRIDPAAAQVRFTSDRTLLLRVLGNLVRNAIEASSSRQPVTLGCIADATHVQFTVHNSGHIAPDVQFQIFQRSFSTKGFGRGLGTYSIRLLTERYLKGSVSFTSSAVSGTIFRVRYPLAQPA
jgi:signal transduction histidine kinase